MGYDISTSLLKLFVGLPIVILLAYLSLKLTNKYLRKMNDGKFLVVLETVQVFNKSALSIVKIGEEYHVMGVSDSGVQSIKKLNDEEIMKFEDSKDFEMNKLRRKLKNK